MDPRYFLPAHYKGGVSVLTPARPLSDIEARHPALRGAKSPMQTLRIKLSSFSGTAPGDDGRPRPGPAKDLVALLAGVAVTVAAAGALLALTGTASPLRGLLTLFFLLAAPGAAIGAALHGLAPLGRVVASVAGAVAVDLLVAQALLALHLWSVRGGIVAVAAISSLVLLLVSVRRLRGRTERRRTP